MERAALPCGRCHRFAGTGLQPCLSGRLCGANSAENQSADPLGNRVIPAVRVTLAAVALLLNVVHVAIGRELPVAAHDAAACQRCESEESNKVTHTVPLCSRVEQ